MLLLLTHPWPSSAALAEDPPPDAAPSLHLTDLIPLATTFTVVVLLLLLLRSIFFRIQKKTLRTSIVPQVTAFLVGLLGLVAMVIALPIDAQSRGQILSFLGILVSAAIALASSTLLGNGLAGVMLRASRSFRIGDFIEIDGYFGRVTERNLFQTEIQTEDRDLVTIPNLHLASSPHKVVRSDGTIVAAELSLGYDVGRKMVEERLITAATACGLAEPFVQVLALGDYSVTYRVAGMLEEVKQVITKRSNLRKRVMDELHRAGIEIVSPTFMNQRVFDPNKTFLSRPRMGFMEEEETPETLIFDKADEAEGLENLKSALTKTKEGIATLEKQRGGEKDEQRKELIRLRIELLEERCVRLTNEIEATERKLES